MPVWSNGRQARLLVEGTDGGEGLEAYRSRGGFSLAAWSLTPDALINVVETSGLRGRGGSAFPTAVKWRSVLQRPGKHVLLVNGAETEPASLKDRALLQKRPFLVIEGALLAARAIGATEVVWYVQAAAQSAIQQALSDAERQLEQIGGLNIAWRVVPAPAGYVAGEESAAVQRVNGKAAKPTAKPPLPFERGVNGQPTLVQNVETLAHLPFIAREGAEAFRSVGLASSPGSMLVTLSGAVKRPGIYEAPTGARLIDVIQEQGGGVRDGAPLQAVLPGGYFAGWLSADVVQSGIRLDRLEIQQQGALLGSGAIVVISEAVCGLTQAVGLLQFFAQESARQCGPCIYGTQAMADALDRILHGQAQDDDLAKLHTWAEVMLPRRGACGHLDGATIAARTAMKVFARDIERHARNGRCGRPTRVILPGLEVSRGNNAA